MAMTSRAIRRDDLTKGDPVYVIVKYGRDGENVKRKKGRVVEVLRAAAVVDRIEGETGARTVRFNELELVPKVGPQPPAVVQSRRLSPDADVPEESTLREVPAAFADLAQHPVEDEVADMVERAERERRPRLVTPLPAPEMKKEESRPMKESPSERPTDLEAWIGQGTALRDQMVERGSSIENDIAQLEGQKAQLEAMLAARREELSRLQKLIDLMAQLDDVKP